MCLRHVALPLLTALTLLCAAPTSGRPAQQPHLKATTELVRVDALVLDRQGRVVADLTAEDFEVWQDGQQQQVTTVAFVQPNRVASPRPALSTGSSAPRLADAPAPTVYRTVAIVVDDLGLSFASIDPAQRALRRFIDEQRQPGDLVAIIHTGQSQGALQQYTRDAGRLHAAVDAIRWNLNGRAPVSGLPSIERDPIERLRPPQAGPPLKFGPGDSPDRTREVYAALGTFGALRAVVDGAGSLPGRKSVVLISEGVRPFDDDAVPNPSIEAAMRDVIGRAARNNVAINTIDPRGLEVAGFAASDNVQGITPGPMVGELRRRGGQLRAEQDSLRRLADDTGGVAVVNSNDLGSGLRRELDDQSGYYLLGYVLPAGSLAHNNRFHRIKVEVKRRDVRVRARPGFYGGPRTTSRTELTSLFSPVEAATVGLRLTSILGRADNGTTVVRLLLHIDANSLSFAESDGWQTTTLDVVGRTLDTDGAVVAASGWRYDFRARVDEHAKTLAQGLLYRNQIVVKRPGYYRVSVGVRDVSSGTLGTASQFIEVPDLGSGGAFALSGLLVSGEVTAAVRDFARGERLTYALEAYNVPPQSRGPGALPMSVELRLLHDGREVLSRPAANLTMPRRGVVSIWGEFDLPGSLAQGTYILEARAGLTDVDGHFRVVTQSTDLTVR